MEGSASSALCFYHSTEEVDSAIISPNIFSIISFSISLTITSNNAFLVSNNKSELCRRRVWMTWAPFRKLIGDV